MSKEYFIEVVEVSGGSEKRFRVAAPFAALPMNFRLPDTLPELPAEADSDDVIEALLALGLVTQASE